MSGQGRRGGRAGDPPRVGSAVHRRPRRSRRRDSGRRADARGFEQGISQARCLAGRRGLHGPALRTNRRGLRLPVAKQPRWDRPRAGGPPQRPSAWHRLRLPTIKADERLLGGTRAVAGRRAFGAPRRGRAGRRVGELRGGWIAEVRAAGMRRGRLDIPARPWLAWLEQTDELAVVDVVLDDAAAAAARTSAAAVRAPSRERPVSRRGRDRKRRRAARSGCRASTVRPSSRRRRLHRTRRCQSLELRDWATGQCPPPASGSWLSM